MFAAMSSSACPSRTFEKKYLSWKGKLCVNFGKLKDLGLCCHFCNRIGFDGIILTL